MTNKEYIEKSLKGLNLSQDDIIIILLKADLEADAVVDVKGCDNAIYNRFSIVLKNTLQNVSEGGYSVSWNIEAVKLYYSSLCAELGKENVLTGRAKVYNRSNFW